MTPLQKTVATSLGIALFFSLLEMAGTPLLQTIVTKDHHPNPDNQRKMLLMQLAGGAATLPINAFFIAITRTCHQAGANSYFGQKMSAYLATLSVIFTALTQAEIGKAILDQLSQALGVKLLGTYQHSGWESEMDSINRVDALGLLGSLMILLAMVLVYAHVKDCQNDVANIPHHAQEEDDDIEIIEGLEMVHQNVANGIDPEIVILPPPNSHGSLASSINIANNAVRHELDCRQTSEDSALHNMV